MQQEAEQAAAVAAAAARLRESERVLRQEQVRSGVRGRGCPTDMACYLWIIVSRCILLLFVVTHHSTLPHTLPPQARDRAWRERNGGVPRLEVGA